MACAVCPVIVGAYVAKNSFFTSFHTAVLPPLLVSVLHQILALPLSAKCNSLHSSFASLFVALQYASMRSTKSFGCRSSFSTPPEKVGNLRLLVLVTTGADDDDGGVVVPVAIAFRFRRFFINPL